MAEIKHTAEIIPFPHDIIVEQKVRSCRRAVERLTAEIEAADPDTQDGMLTVALGERLLEHRLADLRKAEAERAGMALTHNGVVYTDPIGRA